MTRLLVCPAWPLPRWAYDVGFSKSRQATRIILSAGGLMEQARKDGIQQIEPILCAFRERPDEIKRRIGKSAWRSVHHSSLMTNAWRCRLALMTTLDFGTILDIPPGALREALGMTKEISRSGFGIAARVSQSRTHMREAVMLVRDMERMRCTISPAWSLNRIRKEHDAAARKWAMRSASAEPWREAWSVEVDGFRFTLLRSDADFKAESIAQHHCVSSYAPAARAGREITFRIEGRERATASLNTNSERMEIKAACNRQVSQPCRAATQKAFAAYRKGGAA